VTDACSNVQQTSKSHRLNVEPLWQITMPASVSEDLCWAIVRMAPIIDVESIIAFTGVSRRKIFQILAIHRATGDVVKDRDPHMLGRPRHLTSDDVAVRIFLRITTTNIIHLVVPSWHTRQNL
jgi:hypothetical protein